jgi:RalA-binding protein 1
LINSKEFHDVHAIAGLLKLYLRELPSTVLTRERHVDFLHIVGMISHASLINPPDIEDKQARIRRLGELVHGLPKVNFELLRIMSKHLKRIVFHAQENKMTIRNGSPLIRIANSSVGIVFSPTLNIPAPVFSLFITEYDVVFDEPDDPHVDINPPVTQDGQSHTDDNHPKATSHSHHHHGSHDNNYRRYQSSESSARQQGQAPPSFPLHSQGYRVHQPYPAYPPQASQQQNFPQQVYPQHSNQRWDSSREESRDLFW